MADETKTCPTCGAAFLYHRKPGAGRGPTYCGPPCRPSAVPTRDRLPRPAPGALEVNPATCEREYTDDELQFLKAVLKYQKDRRKRFLTCCEFLAIAVQCGYAKVAGSGSGGSPAS